MVIAVLIWSLAAAVVTLIICGFNTETFGMNFREDTFLDLSGPLTRAVFLLAGLRFIWRSCGDTAPHGTSAAGWRQDASQLACPLMFLCILFLPISGVMMVVWDARDVEWYGFHLISAGPRSEVLRDLGAALHVACLYFFAAVLAGTLIRERCALRNNDPRCDDQGNWDQDYSLTGTRHALMKGAKRFSSDTKCRLIEKW